MCALTGQHQLGKQGHDRAWACAILQQAGPRLSHIAAGWTNHVLAACGDAVLAALVRLAANREQAAIAQQDLRAPTRAVRRTSLLTSQTPQGLPTEPAVRQVPAICHQRQHALSDLSVTQPLLQQTGTFAAARRPVYLLSIWVCSINTRAVWQLQLSMPKDIGTQKENGTGLL